MRSNLIHEEYSSDKQYKFQVYQEEKYYEVFLQKRITDEYMGPDWFTYSDVRDYKHIADSFDNAMKIGMEGLRNLCMICKGEVLTNENRPPAPAPMGRQRCREFVQICK